VKKTLFTILLQPIEAIIASMSEIIDQESHSQKLFFAGFIKKLIFGYVYQVSSLRNLSLELQTNPLSRGLGLGLTPFSTLKDGFSRFDSKHFKQLFESVLAQTSLSKIGHLDELGIFRVIDGSLFPTLWQMNWTSYRKTKNAFKLHLSFELNRMIPTEFWVATGNSSERKFLESVLEAGITYIADRGYCSFALLDKVAQAEAFFVFRGRDNLLYQVVEKLLIETSEMPKCLRNVTDEIVIFKGDEQQNQWRLISFEVAGSYFRLLTNRFDVPTLNIIILYAYRWQIELFFKFMKRTMKGIHLFNHSQNGVEIQFYLLMSVAILMLKLKQHCQELEKEVEKAEAAKEKREEDSRSPSEWIKSIARVFYKSWKISKNWLIVVKNSLAQVADYQLLKLLNAT
jgi:Transposase DDE domain.